VKILILGGTAFLGRTFVEIARARGHELTLFNRGQRNPNLFPEFEQILGDRTHAEDLALLANRSWDAVLDTCGYFPRVVGMSADALRDHVGRYLFISSISVYADFSTANQDETAPVATIADPTVEEITGETYGALKALCEQRVQEVYGDRALIVRPGLIVGPYDQSDRFTYWPVRMSRGGDVVVPDRKDQPVQIIDVRDLAAWCLDLLERGIAGVFNATGPTQPVRLQNALEACAEGTEANLIWTDPAVLKEAGVQPWMDLPLAVDFDGSADGLCEINIDRALAAGLTFRPLAETVRDTLDWALARPADHKWRAGLWRDGLDPDLETKLLAG